MLARLAHSPTQSRNHVVVALPAQLGPLRTGVATESLISNVQLGLSVRQGLSSHQPRQIFLIVAALSACPHAHLASSCLEAVVERPTPIAQRVRQGRLKLRQMGRLALLALRHARIVPFLLVPAPQHRRLLARRAQIRVILGFTLLELAHRSQTRHVRLALNVRHLNTKAALVLPKQTNSAPLASPAAHLASSYQELAQCRRRRTIQSAIHAPKQPSV